MAMRRTLQAEVVVSSLVSPRIVAGWDWSSSSPVDLNALDAAAFSLVSLKMVVAEGWSCSAAGKSSSAEDLNSLAVGWSGLAAGCSSPGADLSSPQACTHTESTLDLAQVSSLDAA